MKNNFSMPLFKENLKRFWPISAVGFIVYFLSGPFTLMTQDFDTWSAYEVKWAVGYQNFFYVMLDVVLACVAAVTVFTYLHKANSAAAVHAMPFSRKSLYITNYASGFVLAFLPRLVNTVVLFLIRKDFHRYEGPTANSDVIGSAFADLPVGTNYFAAGAILKYLGLGFVCILFVFAIAVIASMVSGNVVIAMLTAPTMNFILPLFVISLLYYGEMYLYGFTATGGLTDIAIHLSPVLLLINDSYFGSASDFNAKWVVIYIIAAILLSLLGYFFYKKRKLERAGDAYVFDFIKYIVVFFFVYFAATFFGALFSNNMVIAMAIGVVIGFMVGWMIANKTFRIFNLKALKALIIYAVIIVAIVLGFRFDITGYAKRTPALSNIETAAIQNGNIYYSFEDRWGSIEFSEEENIKHIVALQKEIVDKRDTTYEVSDGSGWTYVYIDYTLKNGRHLERSYTSIPTSVITDSADMKALYESDEYRSGYDYIKDIKPRNIDLNNNWTGYRITINDKAEMNELVQRIYQDSQDRKFEDLIYGREDYIQINIEESVKDEYDNYKTRYFSVSKRNKATIEWLKEKGYLDELLGSIDNGFIVLTADSDSFYGEAGQEIYYRIRNAAENGTVPGSGDGFYIISDPDDMHEIALNISSGRSDVSSYNNDDAYWGVYYMNQGQDGYYGSQNEYYTDSWSFNISKDELPAGVLSDIGNYIK